MNEQIKDIMKELNDAYKLLSTALVSGDMVDLVASVKTAIRDAYKRLGDLTQPEEG